MQEIDKLRAERNAVASAMKGKLDLARREELIEQGFHLSICQLSQRRRGCFLFCCIHKAEEIRF
jgi:hypothetical protein